jgi:hypothetical protein
VSDYLNDQAPIEEVGRWQSEGADRVIVAIVGRRAGTYTASQKMTFSAKGDVLQLTDADKARWGADGLTLTRVRKPSPK